MTLDQLRTLCHDQWMQEHRGNVIGLSLTGESLSELSAETITHGDPFQSAVLRVREEDVPALRTGMGVLVTEAVNPVTRSVIKISLAAEGDPDTATVDFGPSVPRGTVTLETAR